ncbi:MAG TPA: hypothetical protein VF984_04810 [Actinomycetota bacterium]
MYQPADSACLAFLGTNPPVAVPGDAFTQDAACEQGGVLRLQAGYELIGAIKKATGMVNDHVTSCFRHRELTQT